jgi:hypothetical protein
MLTVGNLSNTLNSVVSIAQNLSRQAVLMFTYGGLDAEVGSNLSRTARCRVFDCVSHQDGLTLV